MIGNANYTVDLTDKEQVHFISVLLADMYYADGSADARKEAATGLFA